MKKAPPISCARYLLSKSWSLRVGAELPVDRGHDPLAQISRIFLQRPAISVRPTISRRMTAKSAVRPGWVISVHLTETCEKDGPHLLPHVETTSAPVSDDARTAFIHEDFKRKDLTRRAA